MEIASILSASYPLEPMNYCRRWVKPEPDRNYWKVCIYAVAQVTDASPKTIKDWGHSSADAPNTFSVSYAKQT